MVTAIKKFFQIYSIVERVVLVGIFAVMFLAMCGGIISRYAFNSPLIWTEELITTLAPCITVLGIGYGVRHRNHVSVDIAYTTLPQKAKELVDVLMCILMIFAMVLVVKYGYTYAQQMLRNMMVTIKWASKGMFYMSVPIGGGIAIIYLVFDLIDKVLVVFGKERIFDFKKGGMLIE